MGNRRTHKQRAMDVLEAYGWRVADVEGWIPRGPNQHPLRIDMWNLFDLMAVNARDPLGTLAVQVTVPKHVAAHVKKMLAQAGALRECLLVGWRCELWGVRDVPTVDGSPVLARTFSLNGDGSIAIIERSLTFPAWGA